MLATWSSGSGPSTMVTPFFLSAHQSHFLLFVFTPPSLHWAAQVLHQTPVLFIFLFPFFHLCSHVTVLIYGASQRRMRVYLGSNWTVQLHISNIYVDFGIEEKTFSECYIKLHVRLSTMITYWKYNTIASNIWGTSLLGMRVLNDWWWGLWWEKLQNPMRYNLLKFYQDPSKASHYFFLLLWLVINTTSKPFLL